MPPVEHILVGVALLLFLSILASKTAVRSGIPELLLFLLIGMLAGSDGPGGIYFDNPWLAQAVGVVALSLILFSGGLDTDWEDIRPVLREGIALSTLGVGITALLVGVFATALFNFSLLEGLLLGAIISSTDAAAVFSLLRARNLRLEPRLRSLLELESGSNDPMAVFLTLGLTLLLAQPQTPASTLIPMFIQQMTLGAALGYGMGRLMAPLINFLRLEYEGLYPVLTVALALLTYGASATLGGNGFLAVYLAGLVMGNSNFVHKKSLKRFHDGLAWLMQITMFLTLGLQVFPSRFVPVIPVGLLVAMFLILVARPFSVQASLVWSRMSLREKSFVAWVGLRGAAPIVLATFPQLAGIPRADAIFTLVFFIVLTSVLLQGPLIVPVARWLRVEVPAERRPTTTLDFVWAEGEVSDHLTELVIPGTSAAIGRQIVDLDLPPGVLFVLIERDDAVFVPNGGTTLQAGDRVLVLASQELLRSARRALGIPAEDRAQASPDPA